MPSSRVTQADVARHAGVSRTTVSFVLSGREGMRISGEARQRILGAAQELGYRPNLTAQSLRTRKTYTIGLVSDSVASTHYAGEMIRGALEAALEKDHLLYFAETGDDPAVEEKLLQGMLDRQVDGMIHAAMSTRRSRPAGQSGGHRTVLLNCLDESGEFASVVPDEFAAGEQAVRLLLEAGHRDGIHVVGGHHFTRGKPEGVHAGHERMRGIEAATAAAGVELAGVVECDWSEPEHGYRATRSLLGADPAPTALICCNDRLAFGAYQALRDAGLDIPADLSVVSFDDSELASWLRPALTSIALPHHELGRRAVSLLLSDDLRPAVHRIPMPVRRRESISSPRR
ncbi:LacI family DNA-binding transcriptional regulator [Streptomyces albidus (ex Kaewkla and Franco 2022)]|uniref:LacI family DNA-binding transcriptional regulator n=1 Tax=Streptomyces albidus (ex Kaewkla and Franco 2022) TaxID=722709 RepID=UPI0015EF1756|nr:LacI family DNA-binding transcriptional regulator [Streptomyces albidus (ex Kaewkla and Franco 2022)]